MESRAITEAGSRGRDISAPIDHLELGGENFPLVFDNEAMRVAEDVYELQYGRNLNFADIVRHLGAGKLGAIMAVLYGALLSGARANDAKRLTWKEFADRFRLTSLPTVKEMLMDKLQQALPEVEAGEAANPQ